MWVIIALLTVSSAASQDWPVLAVRVSFPEEVPDEPTTTGRGRFDLRSPDDTLRYDLPPHDRRYFEAHLRALAQYWYAASGGRLVLSFDLYPKEDTASYTMPRPLVWYGSGRGDETTARLVRLFKDAVAALDSAEDVDLSKFRSVIVFHAGVGRETGRYNDIPSAYLTPEDFEKYGPVVMGGDTLREGMILPEMADTTGRIGLNGLLAKVFGYSLGLPELSNAEDGLPAMGGWSLMDVGWLNPIVVQGTTVWGFVPCLPSAWELMRLGWLEPLEVVRDTTIWVCAAHLEPPKGAVRAVKVPVGPGEYFLIENRKADRPHVELSQGNNVWLKVDNYDAFVPGSGVLIWHVDERIISEKPEGINDDPLHRGIDLEEADGDDAIGNPHRRKDIWGGPNDPFFLGGKTRFGPDTKPNSKSNEGWDTGIEIEVLDPPRDLMRVRVSFGRNFPGWPKETSEDLVLSAPLPMAYEIFILGRGKLYMFGLRDTSISLPSEPWGMPAAGDIDGDGRMEVTFVDSSGKVVWWPVRGTWDSVNAGFRPTAGPIVAYGGKVVVGGDGKVALVRPGREVKLREVEGRTLGIAFGKGLGLICATDEGLFSVGEGVRKLWSGRMEELSGPIVGDLDVDGREEVALAFGRKVFAFEVLQDTVFLMQGFPISGEEELKGLCMGDVDGDGAPELVASSKGRVYAWYGTGAQVEGFPVAPLSWDGAGEVSFPVLADVDGDGVAEVIFSAENVGVYAFKGDGGPARGFPVPVPEGKLSAPFVGDIDGDGWVEVGTVSEGRVYLWRTKGVCEGAVWPVVGGDLDRAGYLPSGSVSHKVEEELLSGAYIYPNPAEEEATVRFELGRSSKVKVQILDGNGRLLVEKEEEMEGGVREVPLNLSELPPGLYLVRVKARSGGEVQEEFVKMGVVR